MTTHRITRDELIEFAMKFPPELQRSQLDDLNRVAFHADLIMAQGGTGVRCCDIGSGIGMLPMVLAARGAQPTIIDDFEDPVNHVYGDAILDLHRSMGVTVIAANAIKDKLPLGPETLDVVTSFECIEHLHHSPKRLLHQMHDALKLGGTFILSVPNCVDLAKRIMTPLGRASWSTFDSWYESEVFRSHVREPDLRDLKLIAADLGLKHTRYFGRNWWPEISLSPLKRAIMRIGDPVLRLRPTLCSAIYLVGTRGS